MRIDDLCVPIAVAITVSIMPCLAGPCSPEIDRLQPGVDALTAAAAVAGPAGRQSFAAMRHRQPTPTSIATAEAKAKEDARAERAKAAMARARDADRTGNADACKLALADVRHEVDQ